MILVTLGTHEQPFERALDMLAPITGPETVLVQHGHTPPRPGTPGVEWVEFVGREEMRDLVRKASAVVTHAGVGCIVTAISLRHTPVVIARLARYGEHVDDHQVQITTELETAGMVVACLDGGGLPQAIEKARSHKASLPGRGDIRRAIAEATAVAPRRFFPSIRSVVGAGRTN